MRTKLFSLMVVLAGLYPSLSAQNNALDFDGTNDYVVLDNLADDLVDAGDFTVEFWMTAVTANNNSSVRTNFFAINTSTGANKFSIVFGGTGITQLGRLIIYDAGTGNMVQSAATIGDNTCHHIAYTKTGTTGRAYIDGALVITTTVSNNLNASDLVSLGQEWDNAVASDFYCGMMDELRIWGVARTQAQIQSSMNVIFTGFEPGLIGYYKFDQGIASGTNTGVTALGDLTILGNNGTLTSFALTGGTSNWVAATCSNNGSNNALHFDGNNDYVVLDALANDIDNQDFTIEFWMRADMNANAAPRVFIFAVNPNGLSPQENKFGIVLGGTGVTQTGEVLIYEALGTTQYLTGPVVGDNVCHHIAYVRNGSTGTLYVDGVNEGTLAVPAGGVFASNDLMSLGQEWDPGPVASQFYEGSMDELRIWGVARTQAQIIANMNTHLNGSETGLVSYYNFDQGIPGGTNTGITNLNDLAATNNSGTLTNFGLTGNTSNWIQDSCTIDEMNWLNLDGTNDYVVLDNAAGELAAATDYTIELWMRADMNDNLSSPRTVMFAVNPSNGTNGLHICLGGTGGTQTGNLVIFDNLNSPAMWGSSDIIGNFKCHHIAYVKSGTDALIYIDGIHIATIDVGYDITATDLISLGQEWDNASPSDFYNGYLDEVRIWNVVRSQVQIQSNMNTAYTGSETGLIAYYNCNQGISNGNNAGLTTLIDLTSNVNSGTLTNFALTGNTSNWVLNDCMDSDPVPIITMGLDENEESKLKVYPNPTSGMVSIEFENGEQATFSIIDITGRIVHQGVFSNKMQFDLSSYKGGIYNFVLQAGQNTYYYKLVKY